MIKKKVLLSKHKIEIGFKFYPSLDGVFYEMILKDLKRLHLNEKLKGGIKENEI